MYLMRDLDGSNTSWLSIRRRSVNRCTRTTTTVLSPKKSSVSARADCAGVLKVMSGIGLPDGEELMRMLADSLGYAVAKVEQS